MADYCVGGLSCLYCLAFFQPYDKQQMFNICHLNTMLLQTVYDIDLAERLELLERVHPRNQV